MLPFTLSPPSLPHLPCPLLSFIPSRCFLQGTSYFDYVFGTGAAPPPGAGCYTTKCVARRRGARPRLQVLVGDTWYDCPAGRTVQLTGSFQSGSIGPCPPAEEVCLRATCPQDCSAKGERRDASVTRSGLPQWERIVNEGGRGGDGRGREGREGGREGGNGGWQKKGSELITGFLSTGVAYERVSHQVELVWLSVYTPTRSSAFFELTFPPSLSLPLLAPPGQCFNGTCTCLPGYAGSDCSQVACSPYATSGPSMCPAGTLCHPSGLCTTKAGRVAPLTAARAPPYSPPPPPARPPPPAPPDSPPPSPQGALPPGMSQPQNGVTVSSVIVFGGANISAINDSSSLAEFQVGHF